MNALFPLVTEAQARILRQQGHYVFGTRIIYQEMRFNGDRAAFVNGDFSEFIGLLPENVLWLTRNMFACSEEKCRDPDVRMPTVFDWQIFIECDAGKFVILCINEPKESDVVIFDMLLDNVGRSRVTFFKIAVVNDYMGKPQIFSSEALQRFLVGNTMLKALKLGSLRIDADACAAIGQIPHNLDSLELSACPLLNAQQFANGIGANECGPTKLVLKWCRFEPVDFASVFVPLLHNSKVKVLSIACCTFTKYGYSKKVKAASQRNQGLEELHYISGHLHNSKDELKFLLQGIAAAPDLRFS
jgi:hypothetical protein